MRVMAAILSVSLFLIFVLGRPTLAAEAIAIKARTDNGRLTVTVKDARLDQVLVHLGQRFGFKIERRGKQRPKDKITTIYQGSLDSVVNRLMRHTNHLIVRAPGDNARIVKLVLFPPAAPRTEAERAHASRLSRKDKQSRIRRELLRKALLAHRK